MPNRSDAAVNSESAAHTLSLNAATASRLDAASPPTSIVYHRVWWLLRYSFKVVTVEGLSDDDALSPLQAAFRRHNALQCGFCTPGMITTAHALLTEEPDCDADRVREVLSGNLCRCTGYIPIIEAVLEARAAYKHGGK